MILEISKTNMIHVTVNITLLIKGKPNLRKKQLIIIGRFTTFYSTYTYYIYIFSLFNNTFNANLK